MFFIKFCSWMINIYLFGYTVKLFALHNCNQTNFGKKLWLVAFSQNIIVFISDYLFFCQGMKQFVDGLMGNISAPSINFKDKILYLIY